MMRLGLPLALAVVLGLAYFATESARYGDATWYANDIFSGILIEPGHLLWRPIGAAVWRLLGAPQETSAVLWVLQWGSLLATALAAAVMYAAAAACTRSRALAFLVAAAFGLSNGVWWYAFSGCSYGLSLLFAAGCLYFIVRPTLPDRTKTADYIVAGALGGLSSLAWLAQVIVGPALFLLVLWSVTSTSGFKTAIRQATLFTAGYFVVLFLPLLLAWKFSHVFPAGSYVAPHPAGLGFIEWVRSADHGIKTAAGLAQLLRVALGWPQSFVSVGDLGQALRLWLNKESAFPASAALLVLVVFYLSVAYVAFRIIASRSALSGPKQALVVASVLALGTNLFFGFLWQGTDLERYYPSLPFVALLAAVLLDGWWQKSGRTAAMASTGIALVAVVINALGLESALGTDSYRQTWNRELAACCRGNDLVIVLGHRKLGVGLPHEREFPEVLNLALTISAKGPDWPKTVRAAMEAAYRRGGRVILGDSVLRTDAAPRDGWSFRQNPEPSPAALTAFFQPWKTDQRVGTVEAESLWLAARPATTAP